MLDDLTLSRYTTYVDQLLQNVMLPRELLECLAAGGKCDQCNHHQIITYYYNQFLWCVKCAVDAYVPCKRVSADTTYNVPGWNDYVHDKHYEAHNAYLDWLRDAKPHYGLLFYRMQRTRASFKLALRYCRQNEQQLRADRCASNLSNKDPIKC